MLKIYGSKMCPDCVACKANFDYYHIDYEFIDINKDLRNLKEFLILRDTLPVFDRLKKIHDIGLPAIMKEDGSVFTDWESYLEERKKMEVSLPIGRVIQKNKIKKSSMYIQRSQLVPSTIKVASPAISRIFNLTSV